MGTLRVWLFGAVRLDHEDFAIDPAAVHAVQGLLAYLLLHRERLHSREALAGVFWGDRADGKARRCLNTAVWRLRSALEPAGVPRGAYLLSTDAGELGFNCASDHWLDVAVFEQRARQMLARPEEEIQPPDVEGLREGVQLCCGELLEGFYDDWALRERERLRLLYLHCLRRLMHVYRQQGAYEDSLACAQQILACDPLREDVHREAMRLYCDLGQRSLAVRQYQRCREILAGELGILPMEETQALYASIAGHGCPASGQFDVAAGSACPHQAVQQAVQQLRQAMDESALAQARLRRAVAQLEQLLPQSAAPTQQAKDRTSS
jgi:DNA-binding SARP family transcriptional activator